MNDVTEKDKCEVHFVARRPGEFYCCLKDLENMAIRLSVDHQVYLIVEDDPSDIITDITDSLFSEENPVPVVSGLKVRMREKISVIRHLPQIGFGNGLEYVLLDIADHIYPGDSAVVIVNGTHIDSVLKFIGLCDESTVHCIRFICPVQIGRQVIPAVMESPLCNSIHSSTRLLQMLGIPVFCHAEGVVVNAAGQIVDDQCKERSIAWNILKYMGNPKFVDEGDQFLAKYGVITHDR